MEPSSSAQARKLMRSTFTAVLCAILLSACTTVPTLPPRDRVNAADVLDAVQCQLKRAVERQFPAHQWLKVWGTQLTLTLEVNRTGGASASANWSTPEDFAKSFTLDNSIDGSIRATRRAQVTYTLLVYEILKRNCETYAVDRDRPFFQGDLGIGEWLDDVITSMGSDDIVNTPDKFGHTLEFSLTANASIKPTFTFVHVTVGAGVETHPNDLYTLDLAFADATPSPPQRVFVTNFPPGLPTGGLPQEVVQLVPGKARRHTPPTFVPTTISPELRQQLDSTTRDLRLLGIKIQR